MGMGGGDRIFAGVRTMAVEIAPRIMIDEKIRFGRPVIKGTRVDVATIVGHLAAGDTFEDVMANYGIEREDILAALAYAAKVVGGEEVRPASQ
jgi:uncharacterized protein (DUF433 family)